MERLNNFNQVSWMKNSRIYQFFIDLYAKCINNTTIDYLKKMANTWKFKGINKLI